MVEPIDISQVFHAHGVPVLNGAFAVEKKGAAAPGQSRVCRLIMNFVPSNKYQKLMTGDLPTLASSSSWTQLILGQDQVLLWSGDDQKGAFYAWRLPPAWRSFMTFRWPVPGHLLGLQEREVYLASSVIPIGWINAVSLFQHLHRQIGIEKPPVGAGHEPSREWRRDRPIPKMSGVAAEKDMHFVQYYLGDFDCPALIPRSELELKVGTLSEPHRRQREAYRRWGVGISEGKAHVREPRVVRMGAEVDGVLGTVGVPVAKLVEASFFALSRTV